MHIIAITLLNKFILKHEFLRSTSCIRVFHNIICSLMLLYYFSFQCYIEQIIHKFRQYSFFSAHNDKRQSSNCANSCSFCKNTNNKDIANHYLIYAAFLIVKSEKVWSNCLQNYIQSYIELCKKLKIHLQKNKNKKK